VQRVAWSRVKSGDSLLGEIGPGLLVLLGITHSDTTENAARLASKISRLRIFSDADGKMNLSLANVGGSVLVVSQFTLYADTRSGNRPGYSAAARPDTAIPLYEEFVQQLRNSGYTVATGEFGADMQVELLNDGPVTIWLDDAQF
jgi:D-tyrosyl-tRNA(Tyr) deacylase